MLTRQAGIIAETNNFLLGLMVANYRNDGHFELFIDDVYVNNTQARIELGNDSTYVNCSKKEIQIPSTWSNNSIQFTLNRGQLPNGKAYLYVLDRLGRVNAKGYEITL
jgi:hypothetical protein